jgi:hypothetical protein
MQVSKVDFIQKTMSVSLHRLTRASMGSFPAVFVAPSRNREYLDTFLHSAEVVTCTHKRSKPCCMIGRTFPSILPWYGVQSMIQANHCPPPRPRIPTICNGWLATGLFPIFRAYPACHRLFPIFRAFPAATCLFPIFRAFSRLPWP